jgi:hypothetical protein
MAIRSSPALPVSHQVVELASGRHSSAKKGACVVELASMLAGERFGDHPRSVCPVVASFMRTLNDEVGDASRLELMPYASMIVGTRGSRALKIRRARLCISWAEGLGASLDWVPRFLSRWIGEEQAGHLCAKAALKRGLPVALTLADALIAENEEEVPGPEVTPPIEPEHAEPGVRMSQ